MTRYWFKQKTYGYGATPVTWQGWLVTLLVPILVLAISWPLMIAPAVAHTGPPPENLALWTGLLVAVSAGLTALVWSKTEGGWKWRWGGRE